MLKKIRNILKKIADFKDEEKNVEGFRSLPAEIYHPKTYKIYSKNEFENIKKEEMESVPSVTEGHEKTTIWYADENGFIVQIDFKDHESVFINTPCTFTPTFGMDSIDGLFAQDAEEYILSQKLDYKSERLKIFNQEDKIDINSYLKNNGF